MKYRVQLTIKLDMGYEVFDIEADDFYKEHDGSLLFVNITEKKVTINQPAPLHIYPNQYNYPYETIQKEKETVARVAAGTWIYVIGNPSTNV